MMILKSYAQKVKRGTIDMSLTENPLGCSPSVLKMLKNINCSDIRSYPDMNQLKKELSKQNNINPENMLFGCGSEQLIKLICQTFIGKRPSALIQAGSFDMFAKETLLTGAQIQFFNPKMELPKGNPDFIFICNPNNPTGEILKQDLITKIVKLKRRSIIIIDEANGEFMQPSSVPLALKTANCIVLKTFSKALGLAGLRVGFAVGNETLINKLQSAQQPFPLTSLSIKAVLITLKDKKFLRDTLKFVKKERIFMIDELKKRNIKFSDSVTLNIFIEFQNADKLIRKLNNLGVSVIPAKKFPGISKNGFRISLKDRKTNILFLSKLDEALSCMDIKKLLLSNEAI